MLYCFPCSFPETSVGKESARNAGDPGSFPGSGRSAGEGMSFLGWVLLGCPCGSTGKESACNARDLGSIPGLGRSPGEAEGHPLQYSGLESSLDCTDAGHKESDRTERHSLSLGIKRLKRKNGDNDKGENQDVNTKSKASATLGKVNRAVGVGSCASGGQLAPQCWVCVSLAVLIFSPCDQVVERRLLSAHSTKRNESLGARAGICWSSVVAEFSLPCSQLSSHSYVQQHMLSIENSKLWTIEGASCSLNSLPCPAKSRTPCSLW